MTSTSFISRVSTQFSQLPCARKLLLGAVPALMAGSVTLFLTRYGFTARSASLYGGLAGSLTLAALGWRWLNAPKAPYPTSSPQPIDTSKFFPEPDQERFIRERLLSIEKAYQAWDYNDMATVSTWCFDPSPLNKARHEILPYFWLGEEPDPSNDHTYQLDGKLCARPLNCVGKAAITLINGTATQALKKGDYAHLMSIIKSIDDDRKAKKPFMIYGGPLQRMPVFIGAAYLMCKFQLSDKEAILYLRSQRFCAILDKGLQECLQNFHQHLIQQKARKK